MKRWLGIGLVLFTSLLSAESAAGSSQVKCYSTAYACTISGYAGDDSPYLYHNYANQNLPLKHNCTAYIAWIIQMNLPYKYNYNKLGDATTWASRAHTYPDLGITVSNTPKIWSVAQWTGDTNNPAGHVAFVQAITFDASGSPSSIEITEDNYSGTTQDRIIYRSNNWPDNFLDFGFNFYTGSGGGSNIMVTPLSAFGGL